MASRSSAPSRVIFIGNIPFDVTEEQVIDIFKEVGPVQSFRLMFDRETGRPRGFAFCEYADYETASSAIRNLNGYEINGRVLKVDRADQDMLPSHFSSGPSPASSGTQVKPVQNLPGVPATLSTSTIHSVMSAPPFTEPQALLEVISSLKETIQTNPNQARQMLASNPALSYALLQSFVALNLVDMSTVQSLLIQSQQSMQSTPQEGHAPQAANPADQQRQLIMQIMNMTPDQINMLPSGQREQVLQLRQQIMQQQQSVPVRQ